MIIRGTDYAVGAGASTTVNQTVPIFKSRDRKVKIKRVYFSGETGQPYPTPLAFTLYSQSRNEPVLNNVYSTQTGFKFYFDTNIEVEENERLDFQIRNLDGSNPISGNISLVYE